VIGSVKFNDRLTITPCTAICPPGRVPVLQLWQ
jgi:hypothetical protein